MLMKDDLKLERELPSGVQGELQGSILKITGPQGMIRRKFLHPRIRITVEGAKVTFFSSQATKKEKKILYAFEAHLNNMLQGVVEPHQYKLKICSGHFPMTVSVAGQELTVKNFLGEQVPRKVTFPPGVDVKVSGTDILVTSPDKELAGQTAARIEQLCRITNRDLRVFQDGCYITQKSGKSVA